jgi:hypothetical protein
MPTSYARQYRRALAIAVAPRPWFHATPAGGAAALRARCSSSASTPTTGEYLTTSSAGMAHDLSRDGDGLRVRVLSTLGLEQQMGSHGRSSSTGS